VYCRSTITAANIAPLSRWSQSTPAACCQRRPMMSAAAAAANSRVQLMMMVIRRCNFGKSSRGYLSIHPPGKLYATSPRFVTRCNLATPVGGHVVGRRRSSAFRSRNCRLLSVVVATQSLAAEARRRHMIGRRLATIISLLLLLRHMIAVNY